MLDHRISNADSCGSAGRPEPLKYAMHIRQQGISPVCLDVIGIKEIEAFD
jgi:hypothetical protein